MERTSTIARRAFVVAVSAAVAAAGALVSPAAASTSAGWSTPAVVAPPELNLELGAAFTGSGVGVVAFVKVLGWGRTRTMVRAADTGEWTRGGLLTRQRARDLQVVDAGSTVSAVWSDDDRLWHRAWDGSRWGPRQSTPLEPGTDLVDAAGGTDGHVAAAVRASDGAWAIAERDASRRWRTHPLGLADHWVDDLAISDSGEVVVVLTEQTGGASTGELVIARRERRGSWQVEHVAAATGRSAAAATVSVGPTGEVAVVAREADVTDPEAPGAVTVWTSTASGYDRWRLPGAHRRDCWSHLTCADISHGPDGEVVVAFSTSDEDGRPRAAVARRPTSGGWTEPMVLPHEAGQHVRALDVETSGRSVIQVERAVVRCDHSSCRSIGSPDGFEQSGLGGYAFAGIGDDGSFNLVYGALDCDAQCHGRASASTWRR